MGITKAAISRLMAKYLPTFYNQNGDSQAHQTIRPLTTSGKIRRPVLVVNPPQNLDVDALLDKYAIRR